MKAADKNHGPIAILLLVAVLFTAGCAQQPQEQEQVTTTILPQTPTPEPGQTIIKAAQTPGGEILIDGRGMVLYIYDNDAPGVTNCYGECSETWPPVYAEGEVMVARALQDDLVAATRPDGKRQMTYKGMPLYYYSGDQNPGDMNGDGLEGVWFVAKTDAASTTLLVDEPTTTEPLVSTTEPVPTTLAASKTVKASIQGFVFSPSQLTISAGDTVVWTNSDSSPHTITSDSGNELDSPSLSKGETYSHTFMEAGTYSYHCSNHPTMKAKVIVS